MDEATKKRLQSIPPTICAKCGSKRSYTNPVAKCFECKKKFCFDDISANQYNPKMKQNDELRDICDECKDKFDYSTI